MTPIIVPAPPRFDDLRAGHQLVAGLGRSTVLTDIDFETYSEAGYVWREDKQKWGALPHAAQGKKGISVVGTARYVLDPTTEILSLAYNLKNGVGPGLWRPGDPPPVLLFDQLATGDPVEAWHVGFERWVWEEICVKRLGWPPIMPHQWRCAMAKARAYALPGKLAKAGEVLGVGTLKQADGKRLLDKFSVPRNPTKADARLRIRPEDDLEDAQRLYAYNQGDIATEAEQSALIPDLEGEELEWWQTDQEINRRGVALDMESVENCAVILNTALERYNAELLALTGGAVTSASEIQKLSGWLGAHGVVLASLDEEAVTAALERDDLPPQARRALEIRAAIGSASVKKLYSMRNQVCPDGRLRELFVYHGARTGRCTGSGVQPTNMPGGGPKVYRCGSCGRHFGRHLHDCPWCGSNSGDTVEREWSYVAAEDVLEVCQTRSLSCVELYFGEALPAIAGCLRGMFVAGPGKVLMASDYSAIEAVTLAMLAGEKWREEVFRTHGMIYEASASRMFGVPLEEMIAYKQQTGQHHVLRKKGKVGELAFGYGGWIGAALAFGAEGTDDEIKQMILSWRDASPAIVEFWGGQTRKQRSGPWYPELFGLEGAMVQALQNPGTQYEVCGVKFLMRGDVLFLTLLSGRHLTYHRPRLTPSDRREGEWSISYEGWNTNPKSGPMGWARMHTYGGKICENVNQATARDIQRFGLLAQERAGYPIVLHVYDENVAEVPEGFGSLEEFERIQSTMPPWAAGWPVRAKGGWVGRRYRKD